MYDLRRDDNQQPGDERAARAGAPGKRQPTDRLDARPEAAGLGGLEPAPPPAFAGFANHVEDPSRAAPFAADEVYSLHVERMRATTDVNVRSSPQVAADNRVGGLGRGEEVEVLGRDGEWARIVHNGQRAFVNGKYLEPTKKAAPQPEKAAAPPAAAPNAAAPNAVAPNADVPKAAAQPLVDHSRDELIALAERSGNPVAIALAAELRAAAALLSVTARGKKDKVGMFEETGPERSELVRRIAGMRDRIAVMPPELAEIRAGFYRAIQDIAPYYQQWNKDLIGAKTYEFTCNITSLSMALESLGKTASDYEGDEAKLLVAAQQLTRSPMKREDLAAMRLPDFMQIAVVAHFMTEPSAEAVPAAKTKGRDSLKYTWLIETLARKFSANPETRGQGFGDALRNEGNAVHKEVHRRKRVLELAHLRRTNAKEYEKRRAQEEPHLHSHNIEKNVPLDNYRTWIQTTVGQELGSGAAIIVGMGGSAGHFARLQAIHDDGIVIDDPGEMVRRDLRLTYDDARAIGAFCNRILITG